MKSAFLKLLPLLQIVGAFSFQRSYPFKLVKVRVVGRVVTVYISSKSKADLGILRADQKKFLFEEVYRKTLVFEQLNR